MKPLASHVYVYELLIFSNFLRSFLFFFAAVTLECNIVFQQLGNVIKCIGEGETNYPVAYIEEFCWTQGLYTIKEAYNLSWPDKVPYPG